MKSHRFLSLLLAVVTVLGARAAEVATLTPQQDAAIYAENGNNANGKGNFIFIGRNAGNNARRSLIQFDIAGAIPAGSTITSVSLGVTVSNGQGGNRNALLLPMTQAWSEGPTITNPGGAGAAATTGDSTWTHHNFNTSLWATAGGDFDNSVLTDIASINTGPAGVGVWPSSPRLVSTVQGWLDTPSSNHGWLIQGDETAATTAKQIHSGDNATGKPQLSITFLLASYNPEVNLAASFEGGRLVGQTISYSLEITPNTIDGDGSDITGVSVGGSLSGAFAYASGDTDNDTFLDIGETWTYTAQYQVISAALPTASNVVTVSFSDERSDPHTAVTTLNTQVLPLTVTAISPTFVEVVAEDSVEFAVAVTNGLAPISLQWYFVDGVLAPQLIPGEDGPTLSLDNLLISQSGTYHCEATTAFEVLASPSFTLEVHPRIPVGGVCSALLLSGLITGLGAYQLRRKATC